MRKFLQKIPYAPLIIAAVLLGLSPFFSEPHALEKTRMLLAGNLTRLIDVLDLLMHTSPAIILVLKFLTQKES